MKTDSRHWKKSWRIQKLILKILKCFTRTLFASVTHLFVEIVNLLKRRFTTLWKLWIGFQRVNPTLRMSWHLKIVFLEKQVKVLIHRARKLSFQSLFQNCQKNNRLKNRNNRLLNAFIAWREVIQWDSTILGSFFVPKGIMRWIPKNFEVPHDKANAKGPTFVRWPNLVAWFHGFAELLRDQGFLSHKIKLMKGKDYLWTSNYCFVQSLVFLKTKKSYLIMDNDSLKELHCQKDKTFLVLTFLSWIFFFNFVVWKILIDVFIFHLCNVYVKPTFLIHLLPVNSESVKYLSCYHRKTTNCFRETIDFSLWQHCIKLNKFCYAFFLLQILSSSNYGSKCIYHGSDFV